MIWLAGARGLLAHNREALQWVVAVGAFAALLWAAWPVTHLSDTTRLLTLVLLAPLLEEAVFRCGVQEALLQKGVAPSVAVGLTAMLFGLVHVLLRADLHAFAVSAPAVLLGLVYARWRRLLPCVLLHAGMNATWVMWRLIGPTAPGFQ